MYFYYFIQICNSFKTFRFEEAFQLYERAIKHWNKNIDISLEVLERHRDMCLSGCLYKKKQYEDFAHLHSILLKFE